MSAAIEESKAKCWNELLSQLENNPWGKAYRIVTGKCKRQNGLSVKEANKAVNELFPRVLLKDWVYQNADTCEKFSEKELLAAARCLQGGRAAGPDGVPAEVVRIAVAARPAHILKVFKSAKVFNNLLKKLTMKI